MVYLKDLEFAEGIVEINVSALGNPAAGIFTCELLVDKRYYLAEQISIN